MQDGLGDCARPGSPRSSTHPDPVLGGRVAPRAMSMAGRDAAAAGLHRGLRRLRVVAPPAPIGLTP
jgi:hypothetical protein